MADRQAEARVCSPRTVSCSTVQCLTSAHVNPRVSCPRESDTLLSDLVGKGTTKVNTSALVQTQPLSSPPFLGALAVT
jgi:hypothetical protein